jgi:hypothetical protein
MKMLFNKRLILGCGEEQDGILFALLFLSTTIAVVAYVQRMT